MWTEDPISSRPLRLPSISPKYRHPTSDIEATIEKLELESIFKRLDISPSTIRNRSPLVRKTQNDIVASDIHVPCTTTIPEEPEVAAFITALISGQQSPYRKSTIPSLEHFDMTSDLFLSELNLTSTGLESSLLGLLPTSEPKSIRTEARKFWGKYISQAHVVRWDVFEENLLLCLSHSMVVSLGSIRKVDWLKFCRTLCEVLSCEEPHETEWPKLPGTPWMQPGKRRKIMESDWTNFVATGGLNHSVLMAMDPQRSHFFSELYQYAVPSKLYVYGSGDTYQGQWKLSKRHGQGSFSLLATQETYRGQFIQGLREGYGVMQGSENVYKGNWKQDKRDGFGHLQLSGATFRGTFTENEVKNGVCTWSDGSQYDGEWCDSQFHGNGHYIDSEGVSMTGQWKQGKMHGAGVKVRPNGEKWKGEWIAGVLEGDGEIDLLETVYKGSVIGGVEHGYGTKVWKVTHSVYKGQWESGHMEGLGELSTETGDVYTGSFCKDMLRTGTIDFHDGRKYTGDLVDLMMHGSGTLTFPPSVAHSHYTGQFKHNLCSGAGTMHYRNGNEYTGAWHSNQPNGLGTFRSSECTYHGEFSEGLYDGQGEITYKDRSWYKGRFKAGLYDGLGEFCDSEGGLVRGLFESGRPL